jgi:hypothetical protein
LHEVLRIRGSMSVLTFEENDRLLSRC